MIKRFIIILIVLVLKLNAQLTFCLRQDSLYPFYHVGGDEFNANAIDEKEWGLYLWPKTNMAQNFAYDPTNTRIENGVVLFTLNQKDSTYIINATEVDSNFIRKQKITLDNHQFKLKYAAGAIISKKKYHYGLYELRFKIEKGKGVWPAFWFFGGNKNEEIDVFELKGERGNEIHVDTHCPYGCDRGYKNKIGINTNWGDWMPITNYLHEGFNLMYLDWRPNEVVWYINGYPLAYFKGSFANPMNMFINTQVASKFSAFQPGPDETTICPNEFYVDYVRQWKAAEKDEPLVLKVSSQTNYSNRFNADYFNKPTRDRGLMYNKSVFNEEKGMISLIRTSKNKIIVNVVGKIAQQNASINFKGNNKTYVLNQLGREREIILDDNENSLELIVVLNKKHFIRKINLN